MFPTILCAARWSSAVSGVVPATVKESFSHCHAAYKQAGKTCPVCDTHWNGDSEGKLKKIGEGAFVEGQDKHMKARRMADDDEDEEEDEVVYQEDEDAEAGGSTQPSQTQKKGKGRRRERGRQVPKRRGKPGRRRRAWKWIRKMRNPLREEQGPEG